MEATIIRIGNTEGVRIPAKMLKACSLKHGDSVNITACGNRIIIEVNNPFAELDGIRPEDTRDAMEIAASLRESRVNTREIAL